MKGRDFLVNWTRGRLALREMAGALRDRRLWLAGALIVALVALAGPFYTLDTLRLPGRLGYWAVVGVGAWLLMRTLVRAADALAPPRWPRVAVAALAGLAGVLPVTALVMLANTLTGLPLPPGGLWGLAPYVGPVVIGVTVLAVLLLGPAIADPAGPGAGTMGEAAGEAAGEALPAAGQANPVLSRLPPGLGHEVVALNAQDHYVQVTTTAGSALVLMRMGDAVAGMAGAEGMQIHRSWWVNLAQASHLDRDEAGRARLIMSNGLAVPVPRARLGALRRALADRQGDGQG